MLVPRVVANACAISGLVSENGGADHGSGDHDLAEQLHATQPEFEPLSIAHVG